MPYVIGAVIGVVLGALIGVFVGIILRKKIGEKAIGSAESEAKRILDDGAKQAESLKKEALLEAKEDILRQRNDADREIKERRAEVTRMERRLTQKEETLDKKTDQLERKNEQLDKSIHENELVREQIEQVLRQHLKTLEELSGVSVEDAKAMLFERVESETRYELAQRMLELEEQFKEEADAKAKDIISLAIQRTAADQVVESTISVVSLPSEEMKGRIIGREGRNIQSLRHLRESSL